MNMNTIEDLNAEANAMLKLTEAMSGIDPVIASRVAIRFGEALSQSPAIGSAAMPSKPAPLLPLAKPRAPATPTMAAMAEVPAKRGPGRPRKNPEVAAKSASESNAEVAARNAYLQDRARRIAALHAAILKVSPKAKLSGNPGIRELQAKAATLGLEHVTK